MKVACEKLGRTSHDSMDSDRCLPRTYGWTQHRSCDKRKWPEKQVGSFGFRVLYLLMAIAIILLMVSGNINML